MTTMAVLARAAIDAMVEAERAVRIANSMGNSAINPISAPRVQTPSTAPGLNPKTAAVSRSRPQTVTNARVSELTETGSITRFVVTTGMQSFLPIVATRTLRTETRGPGRRGQPPPAA